MINRNRQIHEDDRRPAATGRGGFARFGASRIGRRSRRGAVAVEFAVIAPLIFLFFFASVEFGRVLMVIHGLEAAAREGCRVAVGWNATTQEVEDTVDERLKEFKISGHELTIEPNPPTGARQWEPISVKISVSYDNVGWLPMPGFLKGITLSGSCTLPQESDQQDS